MRTAPPDRGPLQPVLRKLRPAFGTARLGSCRHHHGAPNESADGARSPACTCIGACHVGAATPITFPALPYLLHQPNAPHFRELSLDGAIRPRRSRAHHGRRYRYLRPRREEPR